MRVCAGDSMQSTNKSLLKTELRRRKLGERLIRKQEKLLQPLKFVSTLSSVFIVHCRLVWLSVMKCNVYIGDALKIYNSEFAGLKILSRSTRTRLLFYHL